MSKIIHHISNSVAKDSAFIVTSRMVIIFFSYVQLNIYLSLVSTSDYGIYSLVLNTFNTILVFASFGFPTTATKLIANKEKSTIYIFTIFIVSILSTLVFSIFLFLSATFLASTVYNEPKLILLFQISAFGLFFTLINNVGIAFLQGFSQMKYISFVAIITSTSNIVIAYFLTNYFGVTGMVVAIITNNAISLTLISYILFRKTIRNLDFTLKQIFQEIPMVLKYGLNYYILQIIFSVSFWVGLTILDNTTSHVELGIYQIVAYTVSILSQLSASLIYVIFPRVTSLEKVSDYKVSNTYIRVLKSSFLLQILLGPSLAICRILYVQLFATNEDIFLPFIFFMLFCPFILGIGTTINDGLILPLARFRTLYISRFMFSLILIISALIFCQDYGATGFIISFFLAWFFATIPAILDFFKIMQIFKKDVLPTIVGIIKGILLYTLSIIFILLSSLNDILVFHLILEFFYLIIIVPVTFFIIFSKEDQAITKKHFKTILTKISFKNQADS